MCLHMAFGHIVLACDWCSGFEQVTAAVCLFAQCIIVTDRAHLKTVGGGPWAGYILVNVFH